MQTKGQLMKSLNTAFSFAPPSILSLTICMIIELYAAMAQAEIEKKEKHQREGIDAKKNRGEWDDYGCPAIMSQKEFLEHYEKVLSGELRPFELMKQLGIN